MSSIPVHPGHQRASSEARRAQRARTCLTAAHCRSRAADRVQAIHAVQATARYTDYTPARSVFSMRSLEVALVAQGAGGRCFGGAVAA